MPRIIEGRPIESPRPATARRIFRFGLFELSEREGELRKQNAPCVRLQEQPLRVLVELLAHAGQVVTRDELRRAPLGPLRSRPE